MNDIKGLTLQEVSQKQSLGLTNQTIDSYSPSNLIIFRRNIFSLINVVCVPLLILLAIYEQYREILAFATFVIINTVISILDELRIKRQLDKLKTEFQQKVTVIREGNLIEIPSSEIVEGDFIKAKEGEGIIADGIVRYENYLQIDESALNGESNYIKKEQGEKVLSGAYIVTGDCIYEVQSVGKNNYLNKLGAEAVSFKEAKSPMQRANDKIIFFLIVVSIGLALLNFLSTADTGISTADRILSLTSILSLIIPQTLIFLFTLTITISITKLFNRGVLVQKGGSIDELSEITDICFDKTGTITTNDMKIIDINYFDVGEKEFGEFYNSTKDKIVGVNKTQELLHKHYSRFASREVSDFYQIPFNSKNKFSLIAAEDKYVLFGAFTYIEKGISEDVISQVKEAVDKIEEKGNRVLISVVFDKKFKLDKSKLDYTIDEVINFRSEKVVVYEIEETLNPGIKEIFQKLADQRINVKIISGDSKQSVTRILQKVGMNVDRVVDISQSKSTLEELVEQYDVFTRAKPEEKLQIVRILKSKGHKVAMVGDGINDVLSLKAANVSIAMEGGSKIAREVADIVLLNNDYSKIPEIFYEGENIIFNLKMTSKLFLMKSFIAIFIGIYFTLQRLQFPIDPSSTLIFSFLASSAPSYVLIFTRQKIKKQISFFKDVMIDSLPAAIIFSIGTLLIYTRIKSQDHEYINANLTLLVLAVSVAYSMYLIWKSGKLKSVFIALFLYLVVNIMGIFQTLLPVLQGGRSVEERLFLYGIILIGAGLLIFALLMSFKPKLLWQKLFIIGGALIAVPIISAFPFAQYYSIQSVSADNIIANQVTTLVLFIILIVVDFIITKLFKK